MFAFALAHSEVYEYSLPMTYKAERYPMAIALSTRLIILILSHTGWCYTKDHNRQGSALRTSPHLNFLIIFSDLMLSAPHIVGGGDACNWAGFGRFFLFFQCLHPFPTILFAWASLTGHRAPRIPSCAFSFVPVREALLTQAWEGWNATIRNFPTQEVTNSLPHTRRQDSNTYWIRGICWFNIKDSRHYTSEAW